MPASAPKRERSSMSPFLLPLALLALAVAAAPAFAERIGRPFTGSVGFRQSTADLMRVERLHPSDHVQPKFVEDHEGPPREHLRANPQSLRVASIPVLPPDMLTGYHGNDPLKQMPLS